MKYTILLMLLGWSNTLPAQDKVYTFSFSITISEKPKEKSVLVKKPKDGQKNSKGQWYNADDNTWIWPDRNMRADEMDAIENGIRIPESSTSPLKNRLNKDIDRNKKE